MIIPKHDLVFDREDEALRVELSSFLERNPKLSGGTLFQKANQANRRYREFMDGAHLMPSTKQKVRQAMAEYLEKQGGKAA